MVIKATSTGRTHDCTPTGVDIEAQIILAIMGPSTHMVSCVGRVVVVNPGQFQVIRKSVSKTDKNDARALAFFLSKDMLPETRLKSKSP